MSSMLSLSVCFGFGCSLLAITSALPTAHTLLALEERNSDSYASPASDGASPPNDSIGSYFEPFLRVSPNTVSQSSQSKDRRRDAAQEQSKLNERALPLQLPPQPPIISKTPTETNGSATNIAAFVPPDCWPNLPPPHNRHPISRPHDCRDAYFQVLEGGAMAPTTWDSWHTWTSGSCSIRLIPAVLSSRDEFTRFDIARAAARIQTSCVNEAHGYRGGIMGVGGRRMFDISVEAAANSPLYEDRVSIA